MTKYWVHEVNVLNGFYGEVTARSASAALQAIRPDWPILKTSHGKAYSAPEGTNGHYPSPHLAAEPLAWMHRAAIAQAEAFLAELSPSEHTAAEAREEL